MEKVTKEKKEKKSLWFAGWGSPKKTIKKKI